MKIHLPLLAVAASLLIPSCLEKQAASGESTEKAAALEAEKTKLGEELIASQEELKKSKTALAEAIARADQAEAKAKVAEGKAGDSPKVAEAQKLLTELRAEMDKREAAHRQEIKDLNRQIKAMALEVPANGGGAGASRATDAKTPRHQSTTDRHVAPQ